jgi:predicted glutamine amidotransferase
VADFTMREFARRGEENADGWGLAWYPDRSVALIKEATKWKAREHTEFLETYSGIRSSLLICHVRHLTRGQPTHADTHPFTREFNGIDYCFAHNGTLREYTTFPLGRFRPIGGTDSEHFFCHLLDEIGQWERPLAAEENWPRLHQKMVESNQKGSLNMLLTDGKRLICYHDLGGWKGLHFRIVLLKDLEVRHFEDPDVRLDLAGAVNYGVVVATAPLSGSGWIPFNRGEMLVLEEGAMRYSSHKGNKVPLTKAS